MDYQYLIDVNDEKNWHCPITNAEANGTTWEEARTIHYPYGPNNLMRVTDSVFYPQPATHIHYHRAAYEIFFWSMADFDLYHDGKVATVEPGCISLVRPYEPHGFSFKEPTRKVGFFHCVPMAEEDGLASALLREHDPNARKSPEFPDSVGVFADFVHGENPVGYERITWQEMPGVRHLSKAISEEKFDGVTMKMIIARWETGGVKEIWAAQMEKGFYAVSAKYPAKAEMFYVTDGEVKFKIYDDEFVAHKECIVKIPKYAHYEIETLTNAVMYDVNGQTDWFNYFLERRTIQLGSPERFNDPEEMKALKRKHLCDIQALGKK